MPNLVSGAIPLTAVSGVFAVIAGSLVPPAVPPVRVLGPVIVRAKAPVGAVDQLIELPNGRVVVNDSRKMSVAILNPGLDQRTVVIGRGSTRTEEPLHAYPAGGGTILRYRGDSLLFANPRARTFLVIAGSGKVVREIPFPAGPSPLVGTASPYGLRADQNGRIVYWADAGRRCGPDANVIDSTPLLRADLQTLALDTIGYARRPLHRCGPGPTAGGTTPSARLLARLRSQVPAPPLMTRRDEWGLLSDGTLAIVRGKDYTIDWTPVRGTRKTTPRVLTEERRLSESGRAAIVDSLRDYYKRLTDSIYSKVQSDPQYKRMRPREREKVKPAQLIPRLPRSTDLPTDLRQFQGPIRVDIANNLWIPEAANEFVPQSRRARRFQTTIYDVVNREGVLTDRVRIPEGSTVVGFGKGVVYLTSREGTSASLVRARVR